MPCSEATHLQKWGERSPDYRFQTKITISAISTFGAKAKEKLIKPASGLTATGSALRTVRVLLSDLAELSLLSKSAVATVGTPSIRDLKTRPGYAITIHSAFAGFVELKSRSKGPVSGKSPSSDVLFLVSPRT